MMDKKEISQIIELVFALAAKTVSRLKAEKKATGDYSKTVTFEEKGYEIQFEALQYRGGYPPISVNLTFQIFTSTSEYPNVCLAKSLRSASSMPCPCNCPFNTSAILYSTA